MASDPSFEELSLIIADELSALEYAIKLGLLPDPKILAKNFEKDKANGLIRKGRDSKFKPGLFTVGMCPRTTCAGFMRGPLNRANVHKVPLYIYRCSKCRTSRSVRIGKPEISQVAQSTIFSAKDPKGGNLSIRAFFMLLWSFVRYDTMENTGIRWYNTLGSKFSPSTSHPWNTEFRTVMHTALNTAKPMGGPGTKIYIDDSWIPCAQREDCDQDRLLIVDSNLGMMMDYEDDSDKQMWLFGILCHKEDCSYELRCFCLQDLDWASVEPILHQHIAANSVIVSKDRQLYSRISRQHDLGWQHQINHAQCSKAMARAWITSHYAHVKRSATRQSIHIWLASFWWRSMHSLSPFMDICAEIAKQYPQH